MKKWTTRVLAVGLVVSSLSLTASNYTELPHSLPSFGSVKGEVIYKKSECDYFIAETSNGYVLLEWYGGNDPDEGDQIVGDIESYGMIDIFNLTADSELRVWVEEYWMSKADAMEQYFDHCH